MLTFDYMFTKTKVKIDDFDRRCMLAIFIKVVDNTYLPLYIRSIAFDVLPKLEIGYGREKESYTLKLKYHEGWALWSICDYIIRTAPVTDPEHHACIKLEEQLALFR